MNDHPARTTGADPRSQGPAEVTARASHPALQSLPGRGSQRDTRPCGLSLGVGRPQVPTGAGSRRRHRQCSTAGPAQSGAGSRDATARYDPGRCAPHACARQTPPSLMAPPHVERTISARPRPLARRARRQAHVAPSPLQRPQVPPRPPPPPPGGLGSTSPTGRAPPRGMASRVSRTPPPSVASPPSRPGAASQAPDRVQRGWNARRLGASPQLSDRRSPGSANSTARRAGGLTVPDVTDLKVLARHQAAVARLGGFGTPPAAAGCPDQRPDGAGQ